MKLINRNLSDFIIKVDCDWNRIVGYTTHTLLERVIRNRSKQIWFGVYNRFL